MAKKRADNEHEQDKKQGEPEELTVEGTIFERKDREAAAADEVLPEAGPAEIEALRDELQQARAQADEYLDGWQRARAEFANYKKRVEREQSQVYQTTSGNILKRYLGIIDDLERALKNRPTQGEGAVWAEGIELIYRKLLTMLENEGVQPMEAEGQEFDPTLHEAVTSEDSDQHESGQIIEVLQRGYLLGDKVLRPAMVRVAR